MGKQIETMKNENGVYQATDAPTKKRRTAVQVLAGLGALASGSAMAVVPDEATNAMTQIQTDGLALIDLAWPVAASFLGGFILLRLFKRAVRAAT
ncbi:hypothetical protein CWC31_04165 [Pseudoalteromonas ruthenica]|uniref:major coat protein n=1 Tax=Pseudoalteromonas ruthenica TaxID=151081 RepID=UPI0011091031|nr:major coat protein [Pseudoalteromonas ruthenica]TLX51791.1 hypothetical protein CWC31_04165 [Pseudoalteromonas ruthenica]